MPRVSPGFLHGQTVIEACPSCSFTGVTGLWAVAGGEPAGSPSAEAACASLAAVSPSQATPCDRPFKERRFRLKWNRGSFRGAHVPRVHAAPAVSETLETARPAARPRLLGYEVD